MQDNENLIGTSHKCSVNREAQDYKSKYLCVIQTPDEHDTPVGFVSINPCANNLTKIYLTAGGTSQRTAYLCSRFMKINFCM